MTAPAFEPDYRFPSLRDCLTLIGERFFNESPNTPRFLYRGEGRPYLTTLSATERLARSPAAQQPMAAELIELQSRIHDVVTAKFEEFPAPDRVDRSLALAFLQHYGIPTSLIDLTGHQLVAAYFSAKDASGAGFIAAIPVDRLRAHVSFWDLRENVFAQRARAQHAFALSGADGLDLKAREVRADLGVVWMQFVVTGEEHEWFGTMDYLIDSHFDPLGAFVTSAVFEDVRANGPLRPDTARFLAARLPPAPLFGAMVPREDAAAPPGYRPASAAESGFVYPIPRQREINAHVWAGEIPEASAGLHVAGWTPTPDDA